MSRSLALCSVVCLVCLRLTASTNGTRHGGEGPKRRLLAPALPPPTHPTFVTLQAMLNNLSKPYYDCPLRIAFLFAPFASMQFASSRISTVSWMTALSHHVRVDMNPEVIDTYDVIILLARNTRTYQALKAYRTKSKRQLIGMAKGFAAEQWNLPFIDFAITDNKFLDEIFLVKGTYPLRLPTLDVPTTNRMSQPWLGEFTVDRPAVLCYHGNNWHFQAMEEVIIPGFNRIAKEVPLKLRLVHDLTFKMAFYKVLAKLEFPYETVIYDYQSIQSDLLGCDLGLVPQSDHGFAELAVEDPSYLDNSCFDLKKSTNWWADGVITYKRSANAGRALLFTLIGVPVIADSAPNIIEVVQGYDFGYVAERRSTWEHYVREFVTTPAKREYYAKKSVEYTQKFLTPESIGLTFVDFLLKYFPGRVSDKTATQCGAYLQRKKDAGVWWNSLNIPRPLPRNSKDKDLQLMTVVAR